jgi:hypothetical protein
MNRIFNGFIDLKSLEWKYLRFVSLQGASRDAGTDVTVIVRQDGLV